MAAACRYLFCCCGVVDCCAMLVVDNVDDKTQACDGEIQQSPRDRERKRIPLLLARLCRLRKVSLAGISNGLAFVQQWLVVMRVSPFGSLLEISP